MGGQIYLRKQAGVESENDFTPWWKKRYAWGEPFPAFACLVWMHSWEGEMLEGESEREPGANMASTNSEILQSSKTLLNYCMDPETNHLQTSMPLTLIQF